MSRIGRGCHASCTPKPARGSRNQRLLRLTDRFKEEDLKAPPANGEILLSPRGALLHGIGTRALVDGEVE